MKSLFQNIRAGVITKPACEEQLKKFKHDKIQLTRDYMARKLGKDLYTKKLAEFNFMVELLQSIVDKYDDLKLPLKAKPQRVGVEPETVPELPFNEAFDPISGRELDDEGPNFSTEG